MLVDLVVASRPATVVAEVSLPQTIDTVARLHSLRNEPSSDVVVCKWIDGAHGSSSLIKSILVFPK